MLEEDGHGGAAVEESARRGRAQSAAEGAGYGGQGAEECGVEGQEAVEAGHVENSVTVGDDGNRRDAMTPSLRGGGLNCCPHYVLRTLLTVTVLHFSSNAVLFTSRSQVQFGIIIRYTCSRCQFN